MENNFELATRQKLRFSTNRGMVTTEDLWDLGLAELDTIAKGINKILKESSEESFVNRRTVADKKLTLGLSVVVSIINTKLTEDEKRKAVAERKAKRDKLIMVIADKEDNVLQRKSLTALHAELDKLEEDDEG